jgi:hypothetical protein
MHQAASCDLITVAFRLVTTRAVSQYLWMPQSCNAVSCCTCTPSSLSQIAFVKAHNGYYAVLELCHDCFPTLTPCAHISFFSPFLLFAFVSTLFLTPCAHMSPSSLRQWCFSLRALTCVLPFSIVYITAYMSTRCRPTTSLSTA